MAANDNGGNEADDEEGAEVDVKDGEVFPPDFAAAAAAANAAGGGLGVGGGATDLAVGLLGAGGKFTSSSSSEELRSVGGGGGGPLSSSSCVDMCVGGFCGREREGSGGRKQTTHMCGK